MLPKVVSQSQPCQQCPQCKVPLTAAHVLEHVKCKKELNLTYKDIDLLPKRTQLLDQSLVAQVKAKLDARQPILFMPTEPQENLFAKRGMPVITFVGVLPCGSKVFVGIKDIPIYVDILATNAAFVRKEALINNYNCTEEKVKLFKMHLFQTEPSDFVRFHMASLFERKKLIECLTKHNETCKEEDRIVTASDDTGGNGHFVRLVARNYKFMTCGWNILRGYTKFDVSKYNTEYRLEVSINGFKKLKKVEREQIAKTDPQIAAVLGKDNTMSASWDIETNTKCPHKSIPTKGDPDYTIFMINTMYSWYHSCDPLLQVSCVDSATEAIKGLVVIECNSRKEVLMAHIQVMRIMHPELIIAFNGSMFDWPLVLDQAYRFSLQRLIRDSLFPMVAYESDKLKAAADLLKYNISHKEKMKIDAENDHKMDTVTRFFSMVDVDVRPIFMKLYPKAEGNNGSSLNFYLDQNELPSKEDMPYKIMFKVHDRAHLLKAAPRVCHCEDTTRNSCACCLDKQKHIDCIKIGEGEDLIDYSDELLPELVKDGKPLCCFCGKRPKNYKDMGLVAYYCAIDCLRPQQLMVKRTIILERRGLACSSFVPLYDAIYRADGQKVKNLIGSLCHTMKIAFSNAQSLRKKEEKEHFSGGYVFPPIRGLNADLPTTGLDFASLYPSLMMTYNHSSDMVVLCAKEAARLASLGYTLHSVGPIHYEVGEEKGAATNEKKTISAWTVRHNGIHSTKDTHVITRYERQVTVKCGDKTIKYVSGPAYDVPVSPLPTDWLADMRKNNIVTDGFDETTTGSADLVAIRDGRKALPGERMGLFPIIVKKLFDKRVPIKRMFVKMCEKIKEMKAAGELTCKWEVDGEIRTITLDELCFMCDVIEIKQKAIKVLANTFYGASGDYKNAIYSLTVAAGITESGQANIKKVRDFVVGKGFTVRYGDTDSLYIVAPEHVYAEARAKYQAALDAISMALASDTITTLQHKAKVAYWKELVWITMKVIGNLTGQVSEFLMRDNGTRFLNMAYEEVGFPTMLCGKKKYFLLPHLKPDCITFDIENVKTLMVRGIESVKQGQTSMAKRAANEFMCTVMSIMFDMDPLVFAQKIVERSYTAEINYKDFVLSARYKPNKKNIAVHTFVRRMQERSDAFRAAGDIKEAELTAPPESNDKFEYVIVKKRQDFDLRGRKINITKGDKMEHVRVYLASQNTIAPMEIDRNYYIESAYLRIFARFIAYDKRFDHPTVIPTDDEKYKVVDEYSNNLAEKFLVLFVKSLDSYDGETIKAEGTRNKQLFQAVNKATKCALLAGLPYKFGDKIPEAVHITQTALDAVYASKFTDVLAGALMAKWVATGANLLELAAEYRPSAVMIKVRHACLQRLQDQTIRKLQQVTLVACDVMARHDARMKEVMSKLRLQAKVGNILPAISEDDKAYIMETTPEEEEALVTYRYSLKYIRAIEQVRKDLAAIYELLLKHKRKVAGDKIMKPANIREMARSDVIGYQGVSDVQPLLGLSRR